MSDYPLFLLAPLHDHRAGALVAPGAVALRRLAPGVDRHPAFAGLSFTTTVRVVDRVHGDAANRRPDSAPARCAGLADLPQIVLFVADFTHRRSALDVDLADLTRTQPDLGVSALARQQLCRTAGRPRDLSTL